MVLVLRVVNAHAPGVARPGRPVALVAVIVPIVVELASATAAALATAPATVGRGSGLDTRGAAMVVGLRVARTVCRIVLLALVRI